VLVILSALGALCARPAGAAGPDDMSAYGWELWSWGGDVEAGQNVAASPGWTLHQGGYASRAVCEKSIGDYLKKLSGVRTLVPEGATVYTITFTDGQRVRWEFQCNQPQGRIEQRP